jgi:hypothetical protein
MCDYSLQYVASRPAKVGDKLVSTKFSNGHAMVRGSDESSCTDDRNARRSCEGSR